MRMSGSKSSVTHATIAISVSFDGKVTEKTIAKESDKAKLGIKLHNAFPKATVDYRSPPHTSDIGFELTDELMMESYVFTGI